MPDHYILDEHIFQDRYTSRDAAIAAHARLVANAIARLPMEHG